MKKFLRIFVPLCIALLVAIPFFFLSGEGEQQPTEMTTLTPATATPSTEPDSVVLSTAEPSAEPKVALDDLRGVWVSTILNLDYPSRTGLSDAELMAEADEILDNCAAMGFNAVFFQVRPSGDALYRSAVFPASEYVSGTQGVAPGFDILDYWVDGAHARGMQLHAWINPYRIARQSHDLDALSADNPARTHPEWVVKHTDGNMYLNPGIPEARGLVVDGVREICENYDIDGIHFDDYFYPDGGLDDAAQYAAYDGGKSLDDWRRDNVTALMTEVRELTKEHGVIFGVAPFGIWANSYTRPEGSDTRGNESYSSHFADTKLWVERELLDYIAPQLYWEIGFGVADYKTLVEWWADVVDGTSVKLYVGHASYRCGSDNADSPWSGTGELRRQLDLNAATENVSGSIHFRYKFFVDYPPLGNFIAHYHAASALPDDYPLLPEVEWDGGISVGRPMTDITTALSKYYVLGRCDPAKPLYLNGEVVENVTQSGWFGVMCSLSKGENVLKFTQGDNSYTCVITRGSTASDPTPMDSAAIEGAYPSDADIYVAPGEKITFRCTAPIGSSVSVTVAGNTYKLSPATTKLPKKDGKVYGTNFSYTYAVSKDYAAGSIHTVGRPVYTMTYSGRTSTASAGGTIKCIGDGAPFYAKVSADAAFLYPGSTTSGGPVGELPTGAVDYITAITTNGRWIRLKSGYWVERGFVTRIHGTDALASGLSAAKYEFGDGWDYLRFALDKAAIPTVDYSTESLVVRIGYSSIAPALALPTGSLFTSCAQWTEDGAAYYRLTLRDASLLDGYIFEYDENAGMLSLALKRRPTLKDGDRPLDGLTILLDPGHGGVETGALGPLGTDLSERQIALAIAQKIGYELESLGASCVYIRTDDSTVELHDRLVTARALRPDLVLSVHLNAVDENVDATNIRGVSTWFREETSAEYSRVLAHYVAGAAGLYDRGANKSNLYICRGRFCPATIIECGFICCPDDFEWLTNDLKQAEFAQAVADGVCEYFK